MMEQFLELLLQTSFGTTLFFLIYLLFLRKSTHFRANRFFLLFALIAPVLLAIFPYHYQTTIVSPEPIDFSKFRDAFNHLGTTENFETVDESNNFWRTALFMIYATGVLFFLFRLVIQMWHPIKIINKNSEQKQGNYYIHENEYYALPFSFFNHVFINPKYHKQEELIDILAHEQVHIRERHWIDLLLVELLTVLLWFNPFIWLFEYAIKQNHEYLADEGVLTRGHSPARYQALLINQLMGMQVIGLTNNLNFAFGPTRLKMMTKQKTPKRKLVRLAWAFPVIAILLVAFAEPEYQYQNEKQEREVVLRDPQSITSDRDVTIHGTVTDENGEPLPGTSIVVKGTTTGTVADRDGTFKLDVSKSGEIALVASFVGYETKVNEVHIFENEKKLDYKFVMEKAVIGISNDFPDEMPPPPPLPQYSVETSSNDEAQEVFVVVEDMPYYPNGHYGLGQYVKAKQKELKEKLFFEGKKLEGKATIGFTVNGKGEVTNVQVLEKTNDLAAQTGTTIVAGMENWLPGKQRGKPVSVNFVLPFEF